MNSVTYRTAAVMLRIPLTLQMKLFERKGEDLLVLLEN